MKPIRIVFMLGWLISCLLACNQDTSPFVTQPTAIVATSTPLSLAGKTAVPSHCAPDTVLAKPQMSTKRAAHTATLLPEGTVLLLGGFSGDEPALASAELFDPKMHAFTTIKPMLAARQSHTATLLPNGKVLIAGGFDGDYLATAELYDPATGMFAPTDDMTTARSGHTAVLLNSGKVLLAGGTGVGWSFLASAELYDPDTGLFSATGAMTTARESHTATLLPSGDVLITGGHQGRRANITIYDSAELYHPRRGTFWPTGLMTIKRHKHDATLLADGRVFISGGADERDEKGAYHSTEIYDPTTDAFTFAGEMHSARYKHTGTSLLLPTGQVLLVGGANTTELFDPIGGTFAKIGDGVGSTRLFATATLLDNGDILFAGGYGPTITAAAQAWLLSSCTLKS